MKHFYQKEDFLRTFWPFFFKKRTKEDSSFLRGQKEDFEVLKNEIEEKEDKRGRA